MMADPKRIAFVVSALTGTELTGGVGDAASVYSRLVDPTLGMCDPITSTLITDCPSRSELETKFESFLEDWDSYNQLIFYFSGHGKNYKKYYCLFFGEENSTFTTFRRIRELFELHDVNRAIIILDSCYSGEAFSQQEKSSSLPSEPNLPKDLPLGIAMLTSSRSFEKSKELSDGTGSVFTRLLAQALDTGLEGRKTKDGLIRLGDLVDFVNQKLSIDESLKEYRQRAVFRPLNAMETTIWFSKNKSGKVSLSNLAVEHPNMIQSEGELRVLFDRTLPDHHPCTTASFDDIDWKLVRDFGKQHSPEEDLGRLSPEQLAEKLNLFSPIPQHGGQHLHRTAILCFGTNPEIHFSNAKSVFLITDENNSEQLGGGKLTITGCIPRQIDKLMEQIQPYLDKTLTIDESGRRREYNEDFPLLREIVANALIHRNYNQSSSVQVTVHPQYFDITSPGSFPENINWDKLMELANENERISIPVNMSLSYYMDCLRFYENVGRGFRIISDYTRKYGNDVVTCRILPGPAVRVRVKRISHSGIIKGNEQEIIITGDGNTIYHGVSERHVPFMAPPLPSNFIGREATVNRIIKEITSESNQTVIALRGMGGIGKTTIASAVCHSEIVQETFPDGVLWTSVGSKPVVRFLLENWGVAIGLEVSSLRNETELRNQIKSALHRKKVLIVIDDVWEANDISELLVGGPKSRTLITTRSSIVATSFTSLTHTLSVSVLTKEEALQLFLDIVPDVKDDLNDVMLLLEKLEYHPLAIVLAGRLLAGEADVPSRLRRLLSELLEHGEARLQLPSNDTSVREVLARSVDRLEKKDRERFAMSAVFGADPLSWTIDVAAHVWDCSVEEAELTISRLLRAGLIERKGERYHMHALLTDYAEQLREEMNF